MENNMEISQEVREKREKTLIAIIIIIFLFTAKIFIYLDHERVLDGIKKIITSHAVLITDYLVVGGISGTLINATLIFLLNFTLMKKLDVPIKGLAIASFFTVFGFSFFGKNILNILPIYLGGILYSKYAHINYSEIIITIAFTGALSPYISEIAFNIHAEETSYISAVSLGVIIGFIITPMAKKMASFHEGFNLYNLGFVGGILGAVISSVLKAYNFNIVPKRVISDSHDFPLLVLSSIVFSGLIIVGFVKNECSLKGVKELLKDSGWKVDYTEKYGYGVTFINMGIMGFIGISYIYASGEILSGPLIAGVLTMVGFSAYGKHMFNTIPILLGVTLASLGTTNDYFIVVLSALFGTSLAPISGVYGPIYGVLAGWLHLSVVTSVGAVHGGLNLYNNGFSAGIVAGVMIPILNTIESNSEDRKNVYIRSRKELYHAMAKMKEALKEKEKEEEKEE